MSAESYPEFLFEPSEATESAEKVQKGQYFFSDTSKPGVELLFKCKSDTAGEALDKFKNSGVFKEGDVSVTFIAE